MTNSNTIKYILAFFAISGLILFIHFYSSFFPSANLSFQLNREQIENRAETFLSEWGYDPINLQIVTELRVRKGLLQYVQKYFADNDSIEYYMTHKLPAYYWSIMWERDNDSQILLDNKVIKIPAWINRLGLYLNQSGDEIAFWVEAYDDSTLPSLDESTAKAIADSIISVKYQKAAAFDKIKQQTRDTRTDYSVIYNLEKVADLPENLEIDIIGNQIGRYEFVFENISDQDSNFNRLFFFIILLLIVVSLFIYTFIKKLRDDELSLKAALPLGILIFVLLLMEFLLQPHTFDPGRMLGGLIIGPLISSFLCIIAVSCADAVTRDAWNDKLFSMDLAINRKPYNHFTGKALLRGAMLGLLYVGLVTIFFKIVFSFTFIDFVPYCSDVRDLNSHSPFLFRLGSIISQTIWVQFVFVLFLSSFFARFMSQKRWIVLLVAIFWTFRANPGEFIASPMWVNALFYFLSGVFFVIIFLYYDFLTSFIAFFSHLLVFEAVRMFHFEHIAFITAGSAFVLLFIIFSSIGLVGVFNSINKDELVQYTPKHVKKILDRERFKRELEIAKRVQLNFLPRFHPKIDNLQIASICYPAEEVGGDYYDFIQYDDKRLGVVIGDVSGKGISAAFYMTLTKGFIKSLTRSLFSPKQVLSEINSLFYENVERSHFISMIYGIFDLNKMTFTFARAGHNPVIKRSAIGTTDVMCPPGLALGLDKGNVFNQIIKEETIPLKKGDVFVLYTDGFSEAMDKNLQEFSEEKLEEIINEQGHKSASDLLSSINDKVQLFTRSSPQHDDMTMLIFKVC